MHRGRRGKPRSGSGYVRDARRPCNPENQDVVRNADCGLTELRLLAVSRPTYGYILLKATMQQAYLSHYRNASGACAVSH